MQRRDKRSLALSLVLGDGNIHVCKQGNGKYARLTIDHGLEQADYQAWKAELLTNVFDRDVKMRAGHKGKSIQVSVSDNRMRAWYKFIYVNRRRDKSKILPFIRHPEMALAIWLMDDGYIEPSLDKRYPDALYSAAIRLFTCDQPENSLSKIQSWLKDNFGVETKIKYSLKRSTNIRYPFVAFNAYDSLIVWHKIRDWVLRFKSMNFKFRYLERLYQLRVIQRVPGKYKQLPDDIVRASSDVGKPE